MALSREWRHLRQSVRIRRPEWEAVRLNATPSEYPLLAQAAEMAALFN
jgi:hypothetical protein